MSGSMQVLRSELPLNEEQGQLMDIVLKESDRLNDTIRAFLDYARPRQPLMSRIDVGRLVRDTILLLRNSPEVRALHVIDADVPDSPLWHEADEHYVRQVIWNLASNGLRSMPDGGRLTIAAHESSGADGVSEVLLRVKDQGCGIPEEEVDRIFEPFRSSFTRGSGLGMAIVHRLVTDCGGTIEIASAVGQGTVVDVHLPRSQGDEAATGRAGDARLTAVAV